MIGTLALGIAACGNQGNGQAPVNSAPANSAAGTSEPKASAAADSYEALYGTSVFFGDSITEGLSYHDVLDEKNVLAGAGKTAQFALEDIDDLTGRKPDDVFIQLGSDDILWPTDNPQNYSLTYYGQLIDSIQEKLPQAKITLLSITPVTAEAEKIEPRYRNIKMYNEGLKALAAAQQVGYIDLTSLVAEHADLYDADGIHFQAEFYPTLLDYLKDHAE